MSFSDIAAISFSHLPKKNDCGLSNGCANDDGKQEPNTITSGKGTFKIATVHIMDINVQTHKRTLPLSIEVND